MSTPSIIYAVQESTKSIEGLHAMHTDDAVLVCDEMVHHRLLQGLNRVGSWPDPDPADGCTKTAAS